MKNRFLLLQLIAAMALLTWAACAPAPARQDALTPGATVSPTVTPTAAPSPPATLTATSSPTATLFPEPSPTAPPAVTPVPATGARLTRGPYLQQVTTDSVVVVWETDRPSWAHVVYGPTTSYGADATDGVLTTHHAITLTGLAPYSVYHYQIDAGADPLAPGAAFRSAAGPHQTRFRFAVYGDTRSQPDPHSAVIRQIVAQAPDFALHTGDLVGDGGEAGQWDQFFAIEQPLLASVPVFTTLGNHEQGSPLYFEAFHLPGNERYYTFDYGNARFVCLQVDGRVAYEPGSPQYAWLEETLAANTQPWLFVYFHVPPFTSSEDSLSPVVRAALVPLLERYGVDAVFGGHKHNYERNVSNGITYIVAGGGGAPLYEQVAPLLTQQMFRMDYSFLLMEVDGDRLTGMAFDSQGHAFDTFTLVSNP